jgi:signal transduction histidine kinase
MEAEMLILDLRWLGFALLVAFMGALGAGAWLHGRLRRPAGLPGWAAIAPELDQAPFGLLSLEGRETCRYANPYARRLLGLPARSRLPEAPWLAPLKEDRAAARRAGAASGRYRSVALAEEAGREGRFIHWWLTPFGEADLVFLFDVTAQRRAEEAARRLVNDLSHELRTPLATMLTHLEVLGLPNISDETGRQSTALLKAEARRMARLVHQMLELGRLETAGEIEQRPLDLLAIARGAVAQVAPQAAERGIALSLEADTPLPPCAGDEDRLHQVLLNLLDNAIKYSRPGDRVVVSLAPEGRGVRCAVRDSGPGIAADHLPHLGRRFYRAAPQEVEGSGLGLALVEAILRRHGSRLELESCSEGEETGTVAEFVLESDI